MTLTIILAAVIGFIIALLRNQSKISKATKAIDTEEQSVIQKQGELINIQKEADDAVKSYLESLAKLKSEVDDGDGNGTVH